MTEKVIHEVRFIETDDGFRVEVKGDKDRLKEMGFGPGRGFRPGRRGRSGQGGLGFGPGMRHHREHHMRHGPGFGPFWGWWCDEPGDEDEAAAPAGDASTE